MSNITRLQIGPDGAAGWDGYSVNGLPPGILSMSAENLEALLREESASYLERRASIERQSQQGAALAADDLRELERQRGFVAALEMLVQDRTSPAGTLEQDAVAPSPQQSLEPDFETISLKLQELERELNQHCARARHLKESEIGPSNGGGQLQEHQSQISLLNRQISVLAEWLNDLAWPGVLEAIYFDPDLSSEDQQDLQARWYTLKMQQENADEKAKLKESASAESSDSWNQQLDEQIVLRELALRRFEAHRYQEHREKTGLVHCADPKALVGEEIQNWDIGISSYGSFEDRWWHFMSTLSEEHAQRMKEAVCRIKDRGWHSISTLADERAEPTQEAVRRIRGLDATPCDPLNSRENFAWALLTIARRAAQHSMPCFNEYPVDFRGAPDVKTPALSGVHHLLACDFHQGATLERLAGRAAYLAVESLQAGTEAGIKARGASQQKVRNTFRDLQRWFENTAEQSHHQCLEERHLTSSRANPRPEIKWENILRVSLVNKAKAAISLQKQRQQKKVPLDLWRHGIRFPQPFVAIDSATVVADRHAEDVIRVEYFTHRDGTPMIRLMVMVTAHKGDGREYLTAPVGDYHGWMGVFELEESTLTLQSARFGHAIVSNIIHVTHQDAVEGKLPTDTDKFFKSFMERRAQAADAGRFDDGSSSCASPKAKTPIAESFVASFTTLLYTALWWKINESGEIPNRVFANALQDLAKDRTVSNGHHHLYTLTEGKLPGRSGHWRQGNLKDPGDQRKVIQELCLGWPQHYEDWSGDDASSPD